MRIKLNVTQLTPDRYPSVYWLHVDVTHILLIKQLKEKIQKVLKESHDIELYFDNLPFLDEDDITAINENEEITVIVKEKIIQNYTETNCTKTDTSIAYSNSILSAENLVFKPVIYNQSSTPSTVQNNNLKKKVRKRTHTKKKNQSKLAEPVNKDCLDSMPIHIPSCDESNKTHKRFKLENEEDNQINDSSSSDESIHVIREIIRCNSPFPDLAKNNITLPFVKKQKPFTSTKFIKVPVFERSKKCTPNNTTQNDIYTVNEVNENYDETTSSENCDMMVVDWKNMTPSKILNISELQVHDLIQFKILSMNENGEPEMSSVITARLETINGYILNIQVLSGIKEFVTNISKFQIDEENFETRREVEYNDLYEIYKLI